VGRERGQMVLEPHETPGAGVDLLLERLQEIPGDRRQRIRTDREGELVFGRVAEAEFDIGPPASESLLAFTVMPCCPRCA
jgi:hypothetical protein